MINKGKNTMFNRRKINKLSDFEVTGFFFSEQRNIIPPTLAFCFVLQVWQKNTMTNLDEYLSIPPTANCVFTSRIFDEVVSQALAVEARIKHFKDWEDSAQGTTYKGHCSPLLPRTHPLDRVSSNAIIHCVSF